VIETALGPIDATRLGVTSTNEHLLADSRHLRRPTRDGKDWDDVVRPEVLGDLRWNWLGLADNLHLESADVAAEELSLAHDDGLRSVVEATSAGMGPDHARLPEISRRSGIQIVAAYGSYIDKTLPEAWRNMDEESLHSAFHHALTVRVPGTDYRAGLLGLMGTSASPLPTEERALRAAAHAASAAGAAVSVRLDAGSRRGPEVAETLMSEGMPAGRILFCNIDKILDPAYVREISDTGAVVEFAFGSEHYFADGARDATDGDRIRFLLDLLHDRPDAGVTLSTSVWTKGQLARHGGMGYGHVVRRIVPVLERAGVSLDRVRRLLVDEPATLLDRP
jgi:phosphotriesterase-related protein